MQSLESIPTWFSDYLDISLEAGQAILSLIVILAAMIPILYLNRDRKGFVIELFVFFFLEVFLVGIGWLGFWILIATVALMAIGIASLGTGMITGD